MKLFETFQLGAQYENWEFQLENHQDLVIADRYKLTDYSLEVLHYNVSKTLLYFNADILVRVDYIIESNFKENLFLQITLELKTEFEKYYQKRGVSNDNIFNLWLFNDKFVKVMMSLDRNTITICYGKTIYEKLN
ncbi:hypothetical protein [Nonlabens xiamenensis]|uniref:hypothetical protein n=1 Tax=Nonlabens xiamenensis TaxID=2341043 RepID=UPI000F6095F4|nr:hypothetical protein [Nonlabens xiamenensis]